MITMRRPWLIVPAGTSTPLPSETLFTVENPASTGGFTDANDATPYMLGTLFVPAVSRTCVGGRWWFPSVLPSGPVKWSLWRWDSDVAGTLLGSASFTNPTAAAWNSVQLGAPVALTANTKYVIEVHTPDHYSGKLGFFTGHSQTSSAGNATAPADDAVTPVRNGRLNLAPTSDADFAGQSASGSCYFVDALFTA